MFLLNIPVCGTSMTAYSRVDLSQPISAQLTRQKQGAQVYTGAC